MKKVFSTLILTFVLITSAYVEGSPLQEEKNKQPSTQEQLEEQGLFYWASKPIQCSSSKAIIEQMQKHGEQPTIWMNGMTGLPNGVFNPSRFVITLNVNVTPVTWTLIEFVDEQNQACILGFGKGEIHIKLLSEDIIGMGA